MTNLPTIAVFGGSGKTGIEFIKQALNLGYNIKALVRNPIKLKNFNMVEIVQGNVYNTQSIARVIENSNVVVSFLGHGKGTEPNMQTIAIKNIIAQMKTQNINRLINLTGANVQVNGDINSASNNFIGFMLKLFAKNRFTDGVNHTQLICESELNYTIIRAPLLTNSKYTGNYKTGILKLGFLSKVSRANVAHFALQCITNNSYIRQCPLICE